MAYQKKKKQIYPYTASAVSLVLKNLNEIPLNLGLFWRSSPLVLFIIFLIISNPCY